MELKTGATVVKYYRSTEISICCRIYFVVNRHEIKEKWWRVPLYLDWVNAENTIIWLVSFQIQISNSNFQIQNKLLCLPVFVAKRIFKTHQRFLCFQYRWRLFWFHKDREITKNLFTLAENNFSERKLSCTRLNFGEILFAGTKRAIPAVSLHLACSGS